MAENEVVHCSSQLLWIMTGTTDDFEVNQLLCQVVRHHYDKNNDKDGNDNIAGNDSDNTYNNDNDDGDKYDNGIIDTKMPQNYIRITIRRLLSIISINILNIHIFKKK